MKDPASGSVKTGSSSRTSLAGKRMYTVTGDINAQRWGGRKEDIRHTEEAEEYKRLMNRRGLPKRKLRQKMAAT